MFHILNFLQLMWHIRKDAWEETGGNYLGIFYHFVQYHSEKEKNLHVSYTLQAEARAQKKIKQIRRHHFLSDRAFNRIRDRNGRFI